MTDAREQDAKQAKPAWLRVRLPAGAVSGRVRSIVAGRGLHTVCQSAHCPNMGECWRAGTATFMINGAVCTRHCTFCAVEAGRPGALDPAEPGRVAEAAAAMGLRYVVVTAVTRDDLADGGAGAFATTITALRKAIAEVRIEVLIPDFGGDAAALATVFAARPDVLNHNVETVAWLYPEVRPQAEYARSLDAIARARAAGLTTKSGFMLGLGEREEEIEQTLRELRGAGCDIVTIGQYLRPSARHHAVVRYADPEEFARWGRRALELGFQAAQSGPLVRSSYHAQASYASYRDGECGHQ